MKILAIDQGSNCGWCCGEHLYGLWDLSTRKDESMGMKAIRFRLKIKEIVQNEGIELIVYERIAGEHKNSIIHAAKLVSVIEVFCEENKIDYATFSATELKKFATGRGNAKKEQMVAVAKKFYGYKGEDDNEADAIILYHLSQKVYGG